MLEHARWRTAPFAVACFSPSCRTVTPAGGRIYAVIEGPYDSYCEECGVKVEAAVARKRAAMARCEVCGQPTPAMERG